MSRRTDPSSSLFTRSISACSSAVAEFRGSLRPWVFWPPFLFILAALLWSALSPAGFVAALTQVNNHILTIFSPLFAIVAILALVGCVLVYFSPLGKIRLGGANAKPLLSPVSWFTVSLCINTGVGILFWAIAEPIFHLTRPPVSLGMAPLSEQAAIFSMSTLYLHWSFTPAALFTLPALLFGICFYNLKLPFSLSSCVQPLFGKRAFGAMGNTLDALSLYALVAGMGASLATGVLTLGGGIEKMGGWVSSPASWIVIGLLIIASYLLSAVSGLTNGIKLLSNINTVFYFALVFFILYFGPQTAMWKYGVAGFKEYTTHFLDKSLFLSFSAQDAWPKSWTVFYWAVWLAWAPVTALFLGRIGVGYTVRNFIWVNLVLPGCFAIFWMTVFGSTALSLELDQGVKLSQMLAAQGPEALVYAVFARFPLAAWIIPIFVFTVFISYVTAADSNTVVMAGMSSKGVSPDSPEPGILLKLIWGVVVGAVALIMLCLSGVEGIKTLSYLGGLPALFFEILAIVSLGKLALTSKKARYSEALTPAEA